MKRSQFLRYLGASALTTLGASAMQSHQPLAAQTGGSVTIRSLGHTCFLFSGNGRRILVNPFRKLGCTANYPAPNVSANFVLISSRLFDEGYPEQLPGNPRILFEAGSYEVDNWQFEGIAIAHDRNEGRRFGENVMWRWQQGGLNIAHLGGAAAPIDITRKIALKNPDLIFVPVGGGPKAYDAREAMDAIAALNPKLVVPTHYKTAASDSASCDLVDSNEFVSLFESKYGAGNVKSVGNTLNLGASAANRQTPLLYKMSYA